MSFRELDPQRDSLRPSFQESLVHNASPAMRFSCAADLRDRRISLATACARSLQRCSIVVAKNHITRQTTTTFMDTPATNLVKPSPDECVNASNAKVDANTHKLAGKKTVTAQFLTEIAAFLLASQSRPQPAATVPPTMAQRIHVAGLPARRKKYPAGTPALFVMKIASENPVILPVATSDEV